MNHCQNAENAVFRGDFASTQNNFSLDYDKKFLRVYKINFFNRNCRNLNLKNNHGRFFSAALYFVGSLPFSKLNFFDDRKSFIDIIISWRRVTRRFATV